MSYQPAPISQPALIPTSISGTTTQSSPLSEPTWDLTVGLRERLKVQSTDRTPRTEALRK